MRKERIIPVEIRPSVAIIELHGKYASEIRRSGETLLSIPWDLARADTDLGMAAL